MIKGPAASTAGSFIPCRGGHCPPAKAGTHPQDGGRAMCAPTRPPETRCLLVRPQRPGRIHRTAGAQCAPLPVPRKQDASISAPTGRDTSTGRRAHNVRPYPPPGNTMPPCPPAKAGTHSQDGGRTMCAPACPPETGRLHIRPHRPGHIHRTAGAQCAPLPAPRKRDASISAAAERTAPLPALRGGGLLISPPGNRTPPYPPWPGRRPAGTGTTPAPPSGCPPGRRSPCASGWPWPRPG